MRIRISYDAIIVAKNEPALGRTIQSIKNQSLKPHRIICVVKNEKRKFAGVDMIHEVGCVPGPAVGRDIGILASDCPIIACFDGDVIVPEWYMRKAISRLLASGDHMIGGANYCIGNLLDRFNYQLLALFSRFLDKFDSASIVGNNFVAHRDVISKILFRTDMAMIEDADISRRFRKEGRTVRFYRDIFVYTSPRRIHRMGGWWKYLATYFRAYREYKHTGNVTKIDYFK